MITRGITTHACKLRGDRGYREGKGLRQGFCGTFLISIMVSVKILQVWDAGEMVTLNCLWSIRMNWIKSWKLYSNPLMHRQNNQAEVMTK